ncbi:MAG: uracil-DNA glycosylase [Planctomycetes bacterium]|nr:uracil-DNA glycosylase [Planctomycetota bacterium]
MPPPKARASCPPGDPLASNTDSKTAATGLEALAERARQCTACPLHTGRTQAVFADGSATARIMFVGEAPGVDEDRQGVPFVGRAGQLLTRIIENAMGMARADVYICNVVKCRPPGNRNPDLAEQQACSHFLEAQVRLVEPALILTLGKVATLFLIDSDLSITRMRGRVWDYEGIPVVPTWHPAYLLRNEGAKKETWQDVKLALRTLGLPDAPPPWKPESKLVP